MEYAEVHISVEMENMSEMGNHILQRENLTAVNIEHLDDPVVVSIENTLKSLPPLSSECCIYKIPEKLQKGHLEEYKPRIVSIGPIHHGETSLRAMEEHKFRYLQSFLSRSNKSLEECVKLARTWEERALQCYAETIDMSSNKFIEIILVDGSFIIELFLRLKAYWQGELNAQNDHIFYKPKLIDDVARDMTLLENQIPFFVVNALFDELSDTAEGRDLSILELSHNFFEFQVNTYKLPATILSHQVMHFVDFLRLHYIPSSPAQWLPSPNMNVVAPSATELREAGIIIKKRTSSSLLDIQFVEGVLEIPHLDIDDSTESFFRNLMAFEQCHNVDKYIIQYIIFMDDLINTPKDVEILCRHGVITHLLGSNEDVASMFNNISKNIVCGRTYYYINQCKDLRAYCKTPWHKWKATLKRDYFNTPWAVVSFIAAFILISLTFIQAVCSIISI